MLTRNADNYKIAIVDDLQMISSHEHRSAVSMTHELESNLQIKGCRKQARSHLSGSVCPHCFSCVLFYVWDFAACNTTGSIPSLQQQQRVVHSVGRSVSLVSPIHPSESTTLSFLVLVVCDSA